MYQKQFIYLFSVALAVTILFSCDVLNQDPSGLIPTEDAIVNEGTAIAAVNGMYDALQDGELYGGEFILATELAAGNADAAGFRVRFEEFAVLNVSSTNLILESVWVDFYKVINSANAILENVPGLEDLSEGDKNNFMGAAYFGRALAHFDLLRLFGEFDMSTSEYGVPVVVESALVVEETQRSSVEETYGQIENDLLMAIDLLVDSEDKFLISQGAAQALLARLYLYQKEYEKAAEMATAVIENENYELIEDYKAIFNSEFTSEAIFELEFSDQDINGLPSTLLATKEVVASESFVEDFDENDIRGSFYSFDEANNVLRVYKYSENGTFGDNTLVLRIAEMYLIRAEAMAMTGVPEDGLPDLNEIRTRAGLDPLLASDVPDLESFITSLLKERRLEFGFEGQYWFDLVRTGRVEEVREIESFMRIFPIPQRELNITNLEQNPSY